MFSIDANSGDNLLMQSPATMADYDPMFLPQNDLLASGDGFDFSNDFDNMGNVGTVSPSELMRTDSYIMSNPPSTAFPNLATPDSSYLESPALASSGLNTSPMDNGLLDSTLDFSHLDSMAPLFPPDYDQFGQAMVDEKPTRDASFTSLQSQSTRSTSGNNSPMVRQKSSPGRPPAPYPANVPALHSRKHSESAGIKKNVSKKNLPEIEVDSADDKETAKRKKNTAAARKSRQRKLEMTDAMSAEIQRLRTKLLQAGIDPDAD